MFVLNRFPPLSNPVIPAAVPKIGLNLPNVAAPTFDAITLPVISFAKLTAPPLKFCR